MFCNGFQQKKITMRLAGISYDFDSGVDSPSEEKNKFKINWKNDL